MCLVNVHHSRAQGTWTGTITCTGNRSLLCLVFPFVLKVVPVILQVLISKLGGTALIEKLQCSQVSARMLEFGGSLQSQSCGEQATFGDPMAKRACMGSWGQAAHL